MPPRTSWSNLLPGLIALAVVASIAVAVLVFAGVGRVRGETIRLYVLTRQAQGVIGGTEVWLVGQKIGTVDGVDFRRPDSDTAARVVLVLTVKARDVGQIRHDSYAQIRTGGNIIGPAVVYVTAGTPGSPAVKEGDTLRARPQAEIALAGAKLADATKQLTPLLADARAVIAQVRERKGTLGEVLADHGNGEMGRLRLNVSRLRARMFRGESKIGGAMAHARSALARADSIRTLVNSPTTSLGRFRRDSTLGASIANLRDELANIRTRMESTEGTVGRLSNDSALTRAIADAQREMTLLFNDVRRRPSRYIAF